MHGWPHAGLTTAGSASTSSLVVDDCTGWGPPGSNSAANSTYGATGVIYDGASQETIQCTSASATVGPGTLSLASPLNYTHSAGVMVSALQLTSSGPRPCSLALTPDPGRDDHGGAEHHRARRGAERGRRAQDRRGDEAQAVPVDRMTLVACMNFMKDTLNGLTWPAEMQALPNPPARCSPTSPRRTPTSRPHPRTPTSGSCVAPRTATAPSTAPAPSPAPPTRRPVRHQGGRALHPHLHHVGRHAGRPDLLHPVPRDGGLDPGDAARGA